MSKISAVIAVGLSLGLVCVSASAQQSTESACITVLQDTVGRLTSIDRDLKESSRACLANADALGRAQRDFEAEQQRSANLSQQNSALQTEANGLRRENADQARRLSVVQSRLKNITDQIATVVLVRIRDALSAPRAGCERVDVTVDVEGVVQLSGQLLKADDAKRRVAEATNSIAGAVVNMDGLARVQVCGQLIGDGWLVEVGEGGLRYASNREIIAIITSTSARLPEGTEESCKAIGAMLDASRLPDVQVRRAFWATRPGPTSSALGYCQSSAANESWRYSENSVPQVRALVIQRSR